MKLFAFVCSILFFAMTDTAEVLHWNATEHNFGEIQQNIPATATFELTNNGDLPLFIENVKVGCGCTSTVYDKEAIKPGATTIIQTTFNAKKLGNFAKTATVSTNLSDEPTVLRLKGSVVAAK